MIKFQWSFEAALNFFLLDDGNSKSPKATLPGFFPCDPFFVIGYFNIQSILFTQRE